MHEESESKLLNDIHEVFREVAELRAVAKSNVESDRCSDYERERAQHQAQAYGWVLMLFGCHGLACVE